MSYTVRREVHDGQLVRLALGIDLVDDYLDFLRCHARPNTWLNYAHNLKVFFSLVDKPRRVRQPHLHLAEVRDSAQ